LNPLFWLDQPVDAIFNNSFWREESIPPSHSSVFPPYWESNKSSKEIFFASLEEEK
jgi:hypothetical protein